MSLGDGFAIRIVFVATDFSIRFQIAKTLNNELMFDERQ